MLDGLTDLPLLRVPPGMPAREAKLLRVRVVLPILGGAMHAVQALVFALCGLPELAPLSVIAVLWFAVAIALIRQGYARIGVWLTALEVLCHFTVLTTLLGAASGYPMYGFPIAAGAFVALSREQWVDRWVVVGLCSVLTPAMYLTDPWRTPVYALSEGVTALLFAMNVVGVLFAIVGVVAWFAKQTERAEDEVEREQERSERLLHNILPVPIAERLKDGERPIADQFDEVTVLFADLVGFTTLSARIGSHELVGMLEDVFARFDALADELGLEKIKTIGDAYMIVGGVPAPLEDHAGRMAKMALGMREAVRDTSAELGEPLDIRIGLHTGPVVAGVIGTRKFAYDLWGDTVNTASRMESHGAPGRIQVSAATAAKLSGFTLDDRGTIEVKGKGPMQTFWLDA